MSKFDYEMFCQYYPDKTTFAFSKERYTRAEAALVASQEANADGEDVRLIGDEGYVCYGYGTNEDDEHLCGWWLVTDADKRTVPQNYVPCWTFEVVR